MVDLSRVTTRDATGCQILATGARKLSAAGVTTMLAGLDASRPREQALIALGLEHPDPNTLWFEDLDHALECIKMRLGEERWPDVMADAPVVIADTPLGKGLFRCRGRRAESMHGKHRAPDGAVVPPRRS